MSNPSQAIPQPTSVQQDLFAAEVRAPTFDGRFSTARRTALDATSWIEVVPGWLSGASLLLDRLAASVPFKQHDRRLFDQVVQEPRLTASYREVRHVPEHAVVEAARLLSLQYGVPYDGLWLNLYRNGDDSTAWHRDRHSCSRPECVVPVLTLGATRRFLIKPRTGGNSLVFKPGSGDLIVMGGRAQQDWVHSVPKDPTVSAARISLNFQSSIQAMAPQNSRDRRPPTP